MATLRNKRKCAATNRDNHEDHPRNNQARNTNSPRVQEDYITQVSEETGGKVTKETVLKDYWDVESHFGCTV